MQIRKLTVSLLFLAGLGASACSSDSKPAKRGESQDPSQDEDEVAEEGADDEEEDKTDQDSGKVSATRDAGRDAGRMDASNTSLLDARVDGSASDGSTSDVTDSGGSLVDAGGAIPDGESACKGPLSPKVEPLAANLALPIVFVHGFAGSGQQYQSQAMRFVANGYPAERIVAYDHDGSGADFAAYADGVDQVVDSVRQKFGVEKVYLVGHSRGTFVSSEYLGDAQRAAKVAKYISLDGVGCIFVPVPCLAPSQSTLPGHAHVEVSTSAESFKAQYEFLIGRAPTVTDILPNGEPIEISGRVVNFPANTGRAGSTLEIWEINAETGARLRDRPDATFPLDASGDFGPTKVGCGKHYEKVIVTPNNISHHFYFQPYVRSTSLVRLLSSDGESDTARNTNRTDNHTAVIAMRMREWNTTDVLEISTTRPSGGQPAINAIVSAVGNANIAIHLHDDAASPGRSSLGQLPNLTGSFQASVDVFMPASNPPDGTVTLKSLPRGDAAKPQILKFPNWPSTSHTVTAMFNDYAQVAP